MRAYVLMHAIEGETGASLVLLRRTRGVLSARRMAGARDNLALVDGDSIDDLDGMVAERIGVMPGIFGARASFHLGGPEAAANETDERGTLR